MRAKNEAKEMSEKVFIKNRKDKKIAVVVENPEGSRLAVVMHGFGANKDKEPILGIVETFVEQNFIVIKFDTTNTEGESDGQLFDATTTGYYEDLEDVIAWVKVQKWCKKPFFLVGHSLGGLCVSLYTVNHPEDVTALAPIATAVSGKLSLETNRNKNWREWEEKGYSEYISNSGRIKRTPWSHYEDRLKYNLLPFADRIKIPILMIVGDKDVMTPLAHQQILFNAFNTDKEFHIIKDAIHDFTGDVYINELKNLFRNWIKRVIK